MKTIFLSLFILIISSNILSEEIPDVTIKVYGMETTSFDYIFKLRQDSQFARIELDCQSFFNGLNFYSGEKMVHSITLGSVECENLFFSIENKKNGILCLNVSFESNKFSIGAEKTCSL
ncbi:hypothetical protein OAK75_08270 [Bacteriovoracales bacterium]|nr:hypothetical protein [Bacteriovoracales bacterium]